MNSPIRVVLAEYRTSSHGETSFCVSILLCVYIDVTVSQILGSLDKKGRTYNERQVGVA